MLRQQIPENAISIFDDEPQPSNLISLYSSKLIAFAAGTLVRMYVCTICDSKACTWEQIQHRRIRKETEKNRKEKRMKSFNE